MPTRKPYPTDVSEEEWAFVAPYLALVRADAPQRVHDLREVFDALRWVVRAGAPWRMLPHDLPPWEAVYQQTQRWLKAGAFEAMVQDLRALLRLARGRAPGPTAAVLDSRTLRSTPESGHRGGYDGAKRKKGFVLLPRRWVVERSFAWAARFRRLAKDYERLPETVAGLHFVAFAWLFLHRVIPVLWSSP
jgi:transposase